LRDNLPGLEPAEILRLEEARHPAACCDKADSALRFI